MTKKLAKCEITAGVIPSISNSCVKKKSTDTLSFTTITTQRRLK